MTESVSLPPHGGIGAVRHVAVAIGQAGVFLGITAEDGPRVLHGRISGNAIEWSKPWLVPVPPTRPRITQPGSWSEYGESLDGLHLTIDELDPMRIAVNRLEYQGGSYGIVVHRWNETSEEVAHPSDSDIRFGMPMLLRGAELFTHDMGAFWQFRLTGTSAEANELSLDDTIDELGWHAAFDETSQAVILSAFSDIVVLGRTPAGTYELQRHVKERAPTEDLAVSGEGQTIVAFNRNDGFDLVTYDRGWRELRQRTITTSSLDGDPQPRHVKQLKLTTDGSRVVVETNRGLFVVDTGSGRHVRIAPPSNDSEVALAMFADHVVVASNEGIMLCSVAGAF